MKSVNRLEYAADLKSRKIDGLKGRLQKSILISVLCEVNVRVFVEEYQRVRDPTVTHGHLRGLWAVVDVHFLT